MAANRVLYWGSGSTPCFRVLFALEEKGLEYESKLLEFSKSSFSSTESYRNDRMEQRNTKVKRSLHSIHAVSFRRSKTATLSLTNLPLSCSTLKVNIRKSRSFLQMPQRRRGCDLWFEWTSPEHGLAPKVYQRFAEAMVLDRVTFPYALPKVGCPRSLRLLFYLCLSVR